MTARISLRARRHRLLGSGGGGIDGGVSADCVAEALLLRGLVLLASRARQLGPASCGGGRVDDVVLGSASAQRQREPSFKAVLCVARQACAGLPELVRSRRSAVARRPNQARCPSRFYRYKTGLTPLLRGIHTGTLPMVSQRHIMALQVLRFPGSRAAYHRDVQPTVPQ